MPELAFQITGCEPVSNAASPTLALRLRVANHSPAAIHSISLRCQIQIESPKRRYAESERGRLVDLFGDTSRWGQTLRPLLWANTSLVVGPFQETIDVDLPLACTFDFNIAAAKYFDALDAGEVPLLILFSGTVFYANPAGALQVEQIPWSRECTFRLPVQSWKDMMALYYPNTAWLCLRKDVFDRLHEYKMQQGIPTWEQTLESILP